MFRTILKMNKSRYIIMLQLFSISILIRTNAIILSLIFSVDSVYELSNLHDGKSYITIAKSFPVPYKDPSIFAPNLRHFPLYPLFIYLFSGFFRSYSFSSIFVSAIFSSAAVCIFFLVAERLCAAPDACSMVFISLPFGWLAVSSLARSEGVFMFLTLLSIYFFLCEKHWLSALSLGFAIVTRITGIFILFIYFVYLVYSRKTKAISQLPVYFIALVPLLLYSLYLYNQFGSPLAYVDAQSHAYRGRIFDFPFKSIVMGICNPKIIVLKKIQVAVLVLIYVYAWWVSFHRAGNKLMKFPFIWISVFIVHALTMGGESSVVGFRVFARLMIPAAPAVILVLMEKVPRRFWNFLSIGGMMLAIIYVVLYVYIMVEWPALEY